MLCGFGGLDFLHPLFLADFPGRQNPGENHLSKIIFLYIVRDGSQQEPTQEDSGVF